MISNLFRLVRPAAVVSAVSILGSVRLEKSAAPSIHKTPTHDPLGLEKFLEEGGIQFALVVGGCAIAGFLTLAIRDTRRMERVNQLLKSANHVVNCNPAVARSVGRVYAAGHYQVSCYCVAPAVHPSSTSPPPAELVDTL